MNKETTVTETAAKPMSVTELLARQEARQTANSGGGNTLSAYQALIGSDVPKVRVKGLGEVGLRWHVLNVNTKTGVITLRNNSRDETIEAHLTDVVINPVNRSSGAIG